MLETIKRAVHNKSIRVLIVVILTAQISLFAILTGFLAYTSGLQTVRENAREISLQVNSEMVKTFSYYLAAPQQLEQFHKIIVLNHQIDFSNEAQRDRYFVEALKQFPQVTNNYIGLANGEEYGARRESDGSFLVWESHAEKKTLDYYRYHDQWGRQEYVNSLEDYDTRKRPPYLKGCQSRQPGWTNVYPSATGRGHVITAVHPVYDSQANLLGVLGSSLLLTWMEGFLNTLVPTEHSSLFILDKDDGIIAGVKERSTSGISNKEPVYAIAGKENGNRLLDQGLKDLRFKKQSNLLYSDSDIEFEFDGQKYLIYTRPLNEETQVDWLSVLIIPEEDLMHGTRDFAYKLLLITIVVSCLGIGAGIASARYIVNPIMEVNKHARAIADGNFSLRIHADRKDEIGQLICTVNDMSEKLAQYFSRLSENALRINLLTAGLENSSNIVVIVDANRTIWWVNRAFEELLGFTLEEIKGCSTERFLEGNDPKMIAEARAILSCKREWRGELVAIKKDGQILVDEVSVTPILDESGQTSYFMLVGQDITEKVKVREAMLEAQQARAKAEKLYSVGIMASGISHEINQPLNAIKIIAGGLLFTLKQGDVLSTEEYMESIGEIHGQADRIAAIIKHLRTYIRDEQRRLGPCDINSAIDEALRTVESRIIENQICVEKDLGVTLPKVSAQSIGLEQIVINVVTNAIEALEKTDIITKKLYIRSRFEEKVVVEIGNNGPDIAPEFRERMFEPFASSKQNSENQGLGLALIRTIIASYAGTIEISQNENSQVVFKITLPIWIEREKKTNDADSISG